MKARRIRSLVVCVVALCLAVSAQERPELPVLDFPESEGVPVLRVIDGDTVVVSLGGQETTVRLIGVDTPETVHPSKPVEACGKEASQFPRNLLKGESVYVRYESAVPTQDKYDRTLAYLFRAPVGLFW